MNMPSRKQCHISRRALSALFVILSSLPSTVNSFALSSRNVRYHAPTPLFCATQTAGMEEEIDRGLNKAKELLEKSKAKLAKGEDEDVADELPFFAMQAKPSRDGIVKWKDETTGLVAADGEKMAAVSEQEEWEVRSLREVFQNERNGKEDVYARASEQLKERDVAANIFNLRKTLQNEDYQRIFDKRNRFIGEDI